MDVFYDRFENSCEQSTDKSSANNTFITQGKFQAMLRTAECFVN